MSQGEGPSGAPSDPPPRAAPAREEGTENVLAEVLVNQSALREVVSSGGGQPSSVEDEDLALAKILQEQERAFMLLAGGGGGGGLGENQPPEGSPRTPDGEPAPGLEALSDEELARRLQAEEEAEFSRRLLGLAGVAPGEEGEEDEEDGLDPDAMSYEELTVLGEAVGTVSRGISQAAIDALPCRPFERSGEAAEEEQCAVCRLEPEDGEEVAELPCRHWYHPECIAEWLRRNKVCPVCSTEVPDQAAGQQGVLAVRQP